MAKPTPEALFAIFWIYCSNCAAAPCEKFGWRGITDNLRLSSEWIQGLGNDNWQTTTQQQWKWGLEFDFGKLTHDYYRHVAANQRCHMEDLQNELAQMGQGQSQLALLSALRAKHEFLNKTRHEAMQEMAKIEERVMAKNESLIFLEDFRQFVHELGVHANNIESEIRSLAIKTKDFISVSAPNRHHEQVFHEMLAAKRSAEIAKKSFERTNWSFVVGGGVVSRDVVEASGITQSSQPYLAVNINIPIMIATRVAESANQGALFETASSNSIARELQAAASELSREREQLPEAMRALDARIVETRTALAALESADSPLRQTSWLRLKQRMIALESERIFIHSKAEQLDKSFHVNANIAPVATKNALKLQPTAGTMKQALPGERWFSESSVFRARSEELFRTPTADAPQTTRLNFSIVASSTQNMDALASGAERHQWGVFIRAKDQCNLLYFMFRIDGAEPQEDEFSASFVVQQKSNPNLSSHEDCGNLGYQTIQGTLSSPKTMRLKKGKNYILSIKDFGSSMVASLDDHAIWRLDSSSLALPEQSYIGVRSDNVVWDFALHALDPTNL